MDNKRIIIGGGGTGGHVFPAISIAQALMKKMPGAEILFVGAQNKLEMEKVPEAGFNIVGLPVEGFQRKLNRKSLTFIFKLLRSMIRSRRIIKEFKPDAAIGVGGYASGPILRAAIKKNIPVFLQEQNSYAGLTNRLLAKNAKKIFVAWEEMEKYFPVEKIIISGNPVRKSILDGVPPKVDAIKHFELDDKKPVVLSIGGSQGAGSINNSLLKDLSLFGDNTQLIWQTGEYYFEELKKNLEMKPGKNIRILPFIKNMEIAYAGADVIISRAGAGTISELALIGKPAILVPSPNVAEDHQTKNAMALVKKNAALYVKDSEADELLVKTCVDLIRNSKKRNELARNIKTMAIPDSADRIAEEVLKMI